MTKAVWGSGGMLAEEYKFKVCDQNIVIVVTEINMPFGQHHVSISWQLKLGDKIWSDENIMPYHMVGKMPSRWHPWVDIFDRWEKEYNKALSAIRKDKQLFSVPVSMIHELYPNLPPFWREIYKAGNKNDTPGVT